MTRRSHAAMNCANAITERAATRRCALCLRPCALWHNQARQSHDHLIAGEQHAATTEDVPMKRLAWMLVPLALSAAPSPSSADAIADFYRGKSLRMLIG